MGKRKDSKGRVLKSGEGQRPNGTYDYRYTDRNGKRQRVYAKTLDELRRKEDDIQKDILDGIDSSAGEITVVELVERYINLRRDLKQNTLRGYGTSFNRIKQSEFGRRKIKNVKKSDAMAFFIFLHDSGLKRNTVEQVNNLLRPAFEQAVEDDAIRKNPFKFKVSDILPDDSEKRTALTKSQQEIYLAFMRDYSSGNYFDDIVILLHTGLRVSELYGLTTKDVNLQERRISINKQLCRTGDRPYFVTEPKTKSGIRNIPMSDPVYMAFSRVLQNRRTPKVEMMIDGYAGFLFLDKEGKPKVGMHLQNHMRGAYKRFVERYGKIIPKISPHVLRHTFCSDMAKAGIDGKSLQTLMGHSNVSVTYDVYTHVEYDAVEQAFYKAVANT